MKSFLKSVISILTWVISLHFLFIFLGKSIKNFVETYTFGCLLLVALSVLLGVIFANKSAPTFHRIWFTIRKVGLRSSFLVNLLVGAIIAFASMQSFLFSPVTAYANFLLGIFLSTFFFYFLLSIVFSKVGGFCRKSKEVDNPASDLLDREAFIKKMLDILQDQNAPLLSSGEAFVVWIASQWGTGKTWILEEVKKRFIQKAEEAGEQVVWFSFNPWLHSFSNPEQNLVESFFTELSVKLSERYHLEEVQYDIQEYTKAIIGLSASRVLGGDFSGILINKQRTSEALKESISQFIIESGIKLVITFDEVDRLTPKEMVTCVRLVRSLANFSHTTIIVCGASGKVEELLSKANLPKDYLEKIAHLPLSLPRMDTNQLLDILWHMLNGDKLDERRQTELRDTISELMPNPYNYGLEYDFYPILGNMRIIQRLAFTIQSEVLNNAKGKDINLKDFIFLQLIRLNSLPLYEAIQNYKLMWVGEKPHIWRDDEETLKEAAQEQENLVKSALGEISGEPAPKGKLLRMLLSEMFPVYQELQSLSMRSAKDRGGDYRIFRTDYFDRYFMEGLPKGQMSDVHVSELSDILNTGKPLDVFLKDFEDESIAWGLRELATVQGGLLKSSGRVKLSLFLIDEKLDKGKEYKIAGFLAEPEDYPLNKPEDVLKIVQHCFEKSVGIDAAFFEGCQYANGCYWALPRHHQVRLADEQALKQVTDFVCEEFESRFIDAGKSLLELDDYHLQYYWRVLTRFDSRLTKIFENNIQSRKESDPLAFVRYTYVFREYHRGKQTDMPNRYSAENYCEGCTAANLDLAKKHLKKSDGLTVEDKETLEGFIKLTEDLLNKEKQS